MATPNKTRYAILGVLTIKPCSGYDIKKFFDKAIAHYWSENYGHIYPILSQLLTEGLIEPEGGDGRRKVYRITDGGRAAFADWMLLPPEVQPPRSELLLKLSFGNHMPPAEVIAMLGSVKSRHVSRLAELEKSEAAYCKDERAKTDPQYAYWLASLRYGVLSSEATVRWCDETLERLSALTGCAFD